MSVQELQVFKVVCDEETCHIAWYGDPYQSTSSVVMDASWAGWARMFGRHYCPLHAWIATLETGL